VDRSSGIPPEDASAGTWPGESASTAETSAQFTNHPAPTPAEAQALRAIEDLRTLRAISDQERRARVEAEQGLHQEMLGTVRLLLGFLRRRWPLHAEHGRLVARLSGRIATRAGLSSDEVSSVQLAAILADIGFIPMPDRLLVCQATGLMPGDRLLYEQHPIVGQEALDNDGQLKLIGTWVRHHHERWDGNGFPDRLAGEAIPLGSRIIAIADGYVEAIHREGRTAALWRREQRSTRAFEPALFATLEDEIRSEPSAQTNQS
jgi:response regulator RpfG family c-di-GMP phosphodiesterase